ncbi:MAG TPA: hypothetical protein VHM91_03250 [Verrucomicrobiales bacterium]|jgi:hypothetical protein|nr:hypothetical protein [Verrucomicrobiales bacterium]
MSTILVPPPPVTLYGLTGEQPANYFFAGPPTGGADNPYFRPIAPSDIPCTSLLIYNGSALWAGESLIVMDSSVLTTSLTLTAGADGVELDVVSRSSTNGNTVYLSGSSIVYNGTTYSNGFTLSTRGSSVRLRSHGFVWYVVGAPVAVVFS